jgi:tRNA(Ile)-lysidine synthetase-like protein
MVVHPEHDRCALVDVTGVSANSVEHHGHGRAAQDTLIAAVSTVPEGAWAVGVSGGADSVALFMLLTQLRRRDLHVVHLNHETRGAESDEDAAFVKTLAADAGVECSIAKISQMNVGHSGNASARYRRARFQLFGQVVARHGLSGVVLAHHADDQAETVMLRLLRGSAVEALGGIQPRSIVSNLCVMHPLLAIRSDDLRAYLAKRNMAWREDASNASVAYGRNRVRGFLRSNPALHEAMIALGHSSAAWEQWLDSAAPPLPATFPMATVQRLPDCVAIHAVRRWLLEQGLAPSEISRKRCDQILVMAHDAASPHHWSLADGVHVRRKAGHIFLERITR